MKTIFGLLFFPALVFAQTAPAQVAFTSSTQTIATGVVSEQITIQTQDGNGTVFKLQTTGCVSLSFSASGEFSSSASSWSAVSVLTMNKSSANRNFYYKGATAGTHTLIVRLVLKPESEERSCANWPVSEWPTGWTATQDIIVGTVSASSENNSTSSSPTIVSESAYTPTNQNAPSEPVPSLLVKISGPNIATVGADATFSATVFGVKKEPIPNARVVWSFGNGMFKEGISVRYGYNIPGTYAVIADASSAGLAGSARLVVQAIKPDVRIARVAGSTQGFIEIENKNTTELDVSGWGIASGGALFTIPNKTILLPRAKVAFPADALKFSVSENDARLLFPNGTVAAEYVVPLPPSPLDKIETTQKPPLRLADSAPPLKKGQDAENIIATTTPAAIIISSENGSTIWKWMLGVLGAGGAGTAALVAFRFKPVQKDARSDAEKLANEIQIV